MDVAGKRVSAPSRTQAATTVAQGAVPERLRWYNLALGFIHLAQALLIIALSNDFSLPIVGSYLAGPPGSVKWSR